jgi:protein ImuA
VVSLGKTDIISTLRDDILRLEGFKRPAVSSCFGKLGPLQSAFPNHTFPIGCIHEFLSEKSEDLAATCGFVVGLLSALIGDHGACLWISTSRKIFPPALKNFGLAPEQFIFIDLNSEKEVQWAMNEALRCKALTAVVSELSDISFTDSRRLQLAVEQSEVTGFVIRHRAKHHNHATASVSRWKVTSMLSESIDDLPGIGYPTWHAELLRIRNGKPSAWEIQWKENRFVLFDRLHPDLEKRKRKTG